ncbi:MAG TPA: hypothetical protein VGY56_19485 [Verrucomicrobiae bacterium]|nr:hypothetical protein [Verrucomicrobiae bacterium]
MPQESGDPATGVRWLTAWIWLCAGLNVAGWALSAMGQLNGEGYAVVLLIGTVSSFVWLHFDKSKRIRRKSFRKWLHRFKRPFPLAFLILSVMALAGGAIYAPTNYDGLAYRLPRVLHWLAAGQWHWIHTDFPRLNNRACGIEWVSAPLMALLKTDRFLFLINFIPFLFLPGLTFGVLSRLGARRRVAWHWMWIAPTGYCFLLQAASIGNDAIGAPFVLAAIFFALRARVSGRASDLFTSILSAALMTAAKTSNLPLLLPWGIAILPVLKTILQRPVATAAVCVVACFASFLPTAIANQYFCRDWSGLSLEALEEHGSLPTRLGVNTVYTAFCNLTPPVFPEADKWNSFVQREIPLRLIDKLQENFTEIGPARLLAPQMQTEEWAGLGFGVTLLAATSALVAVILCRKSFFQFRFRSFDDLSRTGIVLSAWVAAFALLSQSEVTPIARIMAPYYILLLPLLLRAPIHEQLLKKIWWRASAFIVFALAAGLLVISPARPLFPVGHLLEKLQTEHSNSRSRARIQEVYSVYRDRNHAFAPALAVLPPNEKVLGMVTYDDPEAALWQPFGSRRVVCVKPDDTAAWLKSQGVQYILARSTLFGEQFPDYDDWARKTDARLVRKIKLNIRADTGPLDWYLLKLN